MSIEQKAVKRLYFVFLFSLLNVLVLVLSNVVKRLQLILLVN